MSKKILPQTSWQAKSLWSLERKPIAMLLFGLTLFGIGEAMLVLANLGASPWAVFAQGLAQQLGLNIGVTTLMISVFVMLLWIPLRLRVGLGTIANIVVIALVLGLIVKFVPAPNDWFLRIFLCIGGVVVIGVAASVYLTCHMGAGPRDGLMVGLCQKTGWKVGIVRSLLEISVCGIGWVLGGVVGVGTLLFAFGVGWVVQITLMFLERWFAKPFSGSLETENKH